jgi:hypothetical protein
VHLANRLIPCLIPLGLAALLAGGGQGVAALVFVLLYGLGNGMLTIVKGTAIAQYVSREHVASLNGALGLPQAAARAAAPLALGLLWSREVGYRRGAVPGCWAPACWRCWRSVAGAALFFQRTRTASGKQQHA